MKVPIEETGNNTLAVFKAIQILDDQMKKLNQTSNINQEEYSSELLVIITFIMCLAVIYLIYYLLKCFGNICTYLRWYVTLIFFVFSVIILYFCSFKDAIMIILFVFLGLILLTCCCPNWRKCKAEIEEEIP